MIKKVIRPFWSLDIIKTETWLSEMAISGYRLQNVNLITREFIFENDESKTIHYRICRRKAGIKTTSQSLIRSQWYSVFTKEKWNILANENEASELKIFPSRESVLKRNRTMKYSIGLLLAFLAFTQIQTIILVTMVLSPNQFSQFLSSGFFISRLLVASSLSYIIVKLNQSDKQIRMENGYDLTLPKSTILYGKTETVLRKEGKLIKRIKLAWTYAPDKIENWLEDMEMKGYNLVSINWLGITFNFLKGESRTIKYCVDYQNSVNDSYFEIHKFNRWEMMFTSQIPLMKYTIWRKEYTDERPEIYSDKHQILKHARKQCLLYCVLFIPIILMYITTIVSEVRMTSAYPDMPFSWTTPIIFAVAIVEYGYFTLRSLGYYLRTRKRINS